MQDPTRPPPPGRAPRLALVALLAAGALGGPAAGLASLTAAPGTEGPVLVVAPPWTHLPDAVRSAGGRAIGPVSTPVAMLAAGYGPEFPARLRAAGAWFALDGRRVAQLCGAVP